MHSECIHDTIVYGKRSGSSATIAAEKRSWNSSIHCRGGCTLFLSITKHSVTFTIPSSLQPGTLSPSSSKRFSSFFYGTLSSFLLEKKTVLVVVVNELARHQCGWTTHNISRITGELFARQNWSKQIKKIHTKWERERWGGEIRRKWNGKGENVHCKMCNVKVQWMSFVVVVIFFSFSGHVVRRVSGTGRASGQEASCEHRRVGGLAER